MLAYGASTAELAVERSVALHMSSLAIVITILHRDTHVGTHSGV